MAEMYVGTTAKVPVKNIASKHWGDIIGEIDNQEDLKEALDSKVDKTHSPNALYGTDSKGNQTTYDTSSLFSTESCPDGYTEVEYISSSDTIDEINFVDVHFETASAPFVWSQSTNKYAKIIGKMQQASSNLGFTVTQLRFVAKNPNNFTIYAENTAEGQSELLLDDVFYGDFDTLYGFYINIVGTIQQGDTFTAYENISVGGQYIDTGIQINNYPDGRCGWDYTKSVKTDPSLYPSISEDKYATYLTYCRQMSNYYQTTITKIKAYVSESGYQSGGCVEIYPDEEEYETNTPYGYFYDYNNLHNSTGIYVTAWTRLVQGDTLYFWGEEPTTETVGYETSVKANQSFINAPNNTYTSLNILGSMEQSNLAGCAILAAVGDGVGYKHYDLYVGSSIPFAYKTGVWNNISLHPGLFTCNGESYVPTFESKKIRTALGVNILLFGISRGMGSPINTSGCSMKTTKIYKNGNVVFCGIPCIENATGIAGMYDTVSDTFFSSAKEGVEFIAGPVAGAKKISLGVENPSSILGLGLDNSIQAYKGKNGIVLNAIMETEDYEELEYLESTDGNAAINTGITFESESWRAWEVTYALGETTANPNSVNYIMGDAAFADVGQNYYRTTVGFDNGRARFNYSSSSNRCSFIYDYVREDLNRFHTLTFTNKKLYVDGKLKSTIDPAQVLIEHSKPMHLFCSVGIYNSSFEGGFIGKISRCRYYYNANNDGYLENSRVIMNDLVPVRRKSDGELGFFDKITGRFCPNINTDGVLVAGPVKTSTIELKYDIDEFVRNIAIDNQSSMIISSTINSTGNITGIDVSSKESTVVGYNTAITNSADRVVIVGGGVARGSNMVSIGNGAEGGQDSVSIGYHANRASATESGQQQSVTIGANAQTLDYSVAIGYQAKVLNNSSVAIGHNTTVNGQYSVGIGIGISGDSDSRNRVGTNSIVIGFNAQGNNNPYNTIIGNSAVVNASSYSVVLGNKSFSYGDYNVSIGNYATASGIYSVSVGSRSYSGENAIAIGSYSGSNTGSGSRAGNKSVAVGSQSKALGQRTIVIGYMADANYIHGGVIIGANTSSTSAGSIVIGESASADSSNDNGYGIAIGNRAHVDNGYNIAIGTSSSSIQLYSIAIGFQCSTTGANSIAMGKGARSTNNNEVALGTNAQANGGGSIAIGESAKAGNRSTTVGGMCSATGSASIAIGHASSTSNINEAMAIGISAKAPNTHAVALGYKAETSATGAIQLGQGTNNSQNTLQFMSYPLVQSDGIIPYDRLSEDTPTNGYVLSYDEDNDCLTWTENGQGGGSYVLPIASDTTLGGIKVGDGLQINPSTGVLSVTGGQGGGEGSWGSITGDIEDQTDLMNILNSKFTQTQAMPKASSEYSGKTLQYLGLTDLLYTHGYVYECEYKRISKLTGTSSDDSRFLVSTEVERFEAYFKAYIPNYELVEDTYTLSYNQSEGSWFLYNSNEELIEEISTANIQYMGINLSYIGQNEPEDGDIATLDYIPATDEQQAPFGYIWEEMYVQPSHEVINNTSSWSETDALSANQGRLLQEQIDNFKTIGHFLAIWDCDTGTARYLSNEYQYRQGDYFIVGTKGTVDNTRSGNWSSEEITSTDNLDVVLDDITLFENKCGKVNRSITFTIVSSSGIKCSYDNVTYTKMEVYNTFGIEISTKSEEYYTIGDQVIITYIAPIISYIPVGSEYNPVTGHEASIDDIEISDMFFYDGENWILLANHSRQIAVDATILPNSKNPAENRAIYNALDSKVTKVRQSNILYGTTAGRETGAITVGEGLQLVDGELSSTIDVSTKQDTLVSGENIKTINGNSLLGSGNIVIQGGSGGEGIGTLNISKVFTMPNWQPRNIHFDSGVDSEGDYKGGYRDVFFTLNADIDYIKEHRDDIYVTYSRRNHSSGLRKYRVLNDNRLKTNLKMYCWRMPTYQYYSSEFEIWVHDVSNEHSNDEINYVYFYTIQDYSGDETQLIDDDPIIYISDLRREDEYGDDYKNFSQGNWGTCLNEMYSWGPISDLSDITGEDTQFPYSDIWDIQRYEKYDIDSLGYSSDMREHRTTGDILLEKRKCRVYTNSNEERVYLWANWWENDSDSVYAYLDGNDEIIAGKVPEDKSLIVDTGLTVGELSDEGYIFEEVRHDLLYIACITNNKDACINQIRYVTTDTYDQKNNRDVSPIVYSLDYPIVPVRLSQCRIYFANEVPHQYDEETGEYINDYYNEEFVGNAYTIEEIENDPDLQYVFNNQKQLIFLYPYDTHHLWMRTLRWEYEVYKQMRTDFHNFDDEEKRIELWDYYLDEGEQPQHTYDEETTEIEKHEGTLYAQPWDRHNLKRAMYIHGQRDNGAQIGDYYAGVGDFGLFGSLPGDIKAPRWLMGRSSFYMLPVQFNIATGAEVSGGCLTCKSTPYNVKLTITGDCRHNVM